MRLIAFRRYPNDTAEPCVDRLFRRGDSYALKLTGGGEPDRWEIRSQEAARQWLMDLGPDDDTLTVVG